MALGSLKAALGLSLLLVASTLVVACGETDDSLFDEGRRKGPIGEQGGLGGGDESSSGGVGEVGNVDPNSACATASEGAALQPISLVFMIDRSGSMGIHRAPDTNQTVDYTSVRWNPVKEGLLTFFGDASSTNISASITFFPVGGKNAICDANSYATPVVAMTQLPDRAAFEPHFGTPNGGTPTAPALKGALSFASSVKASGKNVAVVLATDGEPQGCEQNGKTLEELVKEEAAKGVAAGIKTYVIGVGPSTGNLDGFAQAGGSNKAIMIPTNNAAQVSADLRNAIGQIASQLLGCNYGLPAPPDGQSLDINAVNVNYTSPDGALKTLPYSADCSTPNGWRYDNVSAPREIVLCGGSCDKAMGETGAKLDIVFGCATAVAGPS